MWRVQVQLYVSTWVMSLMRAGVDPLVADGMIFCWESGTSQYLR